MRTPVAAIMQLIGEAWAPMVAVERVAERMKPVTMLTNIGKSAINAPWR
jgi:hypothetical protein